MVSLSFGTRTLFTADAHYLRGSLAMWSSIVMSGETIEAVCMVAVEIILMQIDSLFLHLSSPLLD